MMSKKKFASFNIRELNNLKEGLPALWLLWGLFSWLALPWWRHLGSVFGQRLPPELPAGKKGGNVYGWEAAARWGKGRIFQSCQQRRGSNFEDQIQEGNGEKSYLKRCHKGLEEGSARTGPSEHVHGENQLLKVVLRPLHAHSGMHMPHTHIYTINK